jgi:hypothetical protein
MRTVDCEVGHASMSLFDATYERVTATQYANEFDLAAHTANATELFREANDEMKLAALAIATHKPSPTGVLFRGNASADPPWFMPVDIAGRDA